MTLADAVEIIARWSADAVRSVVDNRRMTLTPRHQPRNTGG
jgi:hypothetical protein